MFILLFALPALCCPQSGRERQSGCWGRSCDETPVNLLAQGLLWLPCRLTPRIRYCWRYLKKRRQRKTRPSPAYLEMQQRFRTYDGRIFLSGLERVLSLEHVLLPVASYLHFSDIVKLSMASKCTREIVFPSMDFQTRSRKLRMVSCAARTKTSCYCCDAQTCWVSIKLKVLRVSRLKLTQNVRVVLRYFV